MEKSEAMKRILEEEDFIHAPKFGNSLNKFLAKNDNLLQDGAIARLLMLSQEEVEAIYQESVIELQKEMVEEDED